VARERSRPTALLNTINAIHRRGKYRPSPIVPAGDSRLHPVVAPTVSTRR